MKANCTPQAGSHRKTLSHKDKLALTARLLRQLSGLLAGKQDRQQQDLLLALVSLAALGRRALLPASLDSAALRTLIESAAGGRKLTLDHTIFATRLTAALSSGDHCRQLADISSAAAPVFKQSWLEPLLDDPLLPGWVYQCLSRKPRAQITGVSPGANGQSASARDIAPDTVPALTQWFTPEWIASFLVDETVGRLCLSGAAASEPVRFLDPACGAGHILVPAMQRLVQARIAGGTQPPAVALAEILQEQLFGCDIDPFMITLSGLSIYLAAREIDGQSELPLPQLFHFGLGTAQPSDETAIGSLWLGVEKLPDDLSVVGLPGRIPLKQSPLAGSFSAIATNPPFLSHRLIPPSLSSFLRSHYNSGRFDLYAAFLSLCLRILSEGGRMGVICQQSFMSITRYKELREELLSGSTLDGLIQLGPGAFGPVSGEKINSAIVLAEKNHSGKRPDTPISCWRILEPAHKEKAEREGIRSLPPVEVTRPGFATISGAPFSFWCPPEIARLFQEYPPLQSPETGIVCTNGLFTCNNDLFVRNYQQVPPEEESDWVPYDKGGGHKWYRTTALRLHWGANGEAIRQYRLKQGQSASLPGERFYFRPGVTYSYIGTKGFTARLLSPKSIFDIASSALFSEKIELLYLLGFLNSALVRFLLGVLNPTINFQIGDLRRLPFAEPSSDVQTTVSRSAGLAVDLARELETFDPTCPTFKQNQDRAVSFHDVAGHTELEFQAEIDSCIFDLYEIDEASRKKILEDPWVSRTAGRFTRN